MSWRAEIGRRRATVALVGTGIGASIAVAAVVSGTLRPPAPLDLRPQVVVLGLVGILTAPLWVTRWRATFWIFLAWFMVEDLVRKYLGNDISVYFLKDLLFVMLLIGLVTDSDVRGTWIRSARGARIWLYAMIAWSVILSIPMAFVDVRIPLIALKLDWAYVPLVVAGYVLAVEVGGVRRLLSGVVALGIPACLVGIAQAYVGPEFLRPSSTTETSQLLRLELTRAHDVFQPTGTFVDAGRFGSMAMLTFLCALALLVLSHKGDNRSRAFAIAGVMVGGGAVWAHAGKTGILAGSAIGIVAGFAPGFADRRFAVSHAIAIFVVVVGALSLMFTLFPQISENRAQYFADTLDPRSDTNEWGSRIEGWIDNTLAGLRIGGAIGAGTGASSLGLQYLAPPPESETITGVEQVEGGFASVAQQWGVIGVGLWLAWTLAWVLRLLRQTTSVRGSRLAGTGMVIVAWVVGHLFIGFVQGFQGFQNYYANAYFWMLSGVVFALPDAAARRNGRPTTG